MAVVGVDHLRPATALRLDLGQTGNPLPRLIDIGAAAFGVGAENSGRGEVGQRVETTLAVAQRHLRHRGNGHVTDIAGHPGEAAILVRQPLQADVDVAQRSAARVKPLPDDSLFDRARDDLGIEHIAIVAIVGMEQAVGSPTEALGDAVAGQFLPRRVEEGPAPRRVGAKDHLTDIVEDDLVEFDAIAQLRLDRLAAFQMDRDRHAQQEAAGDEQLQRDQLRMKVAANQHHRSRMKRGGNRRDHRHQCDCDRRSGHAAPKRCPHHDRRDQEQEREARLREHRARRQHDCRAEFCPGQRLAEPTSLAAPKSRAAHCGIVKDQHRRRDDQQAQRVGGGPVDHRRQRRRRVGAEPEGSEHARHERGRHPGLGQGEQVGQQAHVNRPLPGVATQQTDHDQHLDRIEYAEEQRCARVVAKHRIDA